MSRKGDETTMGSAIFASVPTGLTNETTGVCPPWSVATSGGEVGGFGGDIGSVFSCIFEFMSSASFGLENM